MSNSLAFVIIGNLILNFLSITKSTKSFSGKKYFIGISTAYPTHTNPKKVKCIVNKNDSNSFGNILYNQYMPYKVHDPYTKNIIASFSDNTSSSTYPKDLS